MTCKQTCYQAGVANNLNFFRFNGSDPSCFRVCPAGTVADEFTGNCLDNCSTSYFEHGGYCNATCPSGFYAYNVTNKCVSTCPNGYFKNNQTVGGYGICEYPCQNQGGVKLYGDNSTGSCVDICPNGTFSDPIANICVTFCDRANGYYNQLVKISATVWEGKCVTTCLKNFLDSGISYSNPLTGYCVNASDCPTNYFGDSYNGVNQCTTTCSGTLQFGVNASKKCATSCGLNGGFKYITTKVCVKVCPANPSLFGDAVADGGYCVSGCTNPLYYADVQANRTCQPVCLDTPAATFGDPGTQKCV